MAKDEETGVDPVSADGAGASDDDLAARRAQRGGSAADRAKAAEEEQARLDAEEQPREGDGEEDDGQLFVWEQGRKVTLGTLIARNIPVEHVFVFGGKRVKGRGGLMALDEAPILVVRGLSGGTKIVPTHDDDEKVVKVTIESHIASKYVMPAETEEAVALIGPIVDRVRQGRAEA